MPKKIKHIVEVPTPKVRDFLRERQKEGELSTMQNVTLDYASKLSKLDSERAEELVSRLMEEFELSRFTAVQIANILPRVVEELRPTLVSEGRIFLSSELQKILNVVSEYLS